uniref:SCP domain-containing protein n=1 Tax=Knipowitschia caucasica TaxID=637954 RepID=A0AAV2LW66_KNICA
MFCRKTEAEGDGDERKQSHGEEIKSDGYKVRVPAAATIPGWSKVQARPIVLVLVLLGSLVSVQGILDEDQEELLVELHNRYRGVVQPSASAMLPLKWDRNLKLVAEGYAAKCVWNHNPELEDTGENLFTGTGPLDLERALEKWFLERVDYNYFNNSCEDDKMCGHYTQMVWADTHRVGCAVHICAQMEGLDWTGPINYLVCNYYPAGNYEGERPYIEGDWCSQCPENLQNCVNNLCAPDVEPTEAEPTDEEPTDEAQTDAEPTDEAQTDAEPTDAEPTDAESIEPEPIEARGAVVEEESETVITRLFLSRDSPADIVDPDQDSGPEVSIEQEAVVPPPATQYIPPEPLGTEASQTEKIGLNIGLDSTPENGPVTEPEPEAEQQQEITKDVGDAGDPTRVTQMEQKQMMSDNVPPPFQPMPHEPETPAPENRGQKQMESVEKRKRDDPHTSSHSVVLTGSWSLVLLWLCAPAL